MSIKITFFENLYNTPIVLNFVEYQYDRKIYKTLKATAHKRIHKNIIPQTNSAKIDFSGRYFKCFFSIYTVLYVQLLINPVYLECETINFYDQSVFAFVLFY